MTSAQATSTVAAATACRFLLYLVTSFYSDPELYYSPTELLNSYSNSAPFLV